VEFYISSLFHSSAYGLTLGAISPRKNVAFFTTNAMLIELNMKKTQKYKKVPFL